MMEGGVVLLNGTSSAGKGTIARAIQAQSGDDVWLHRGLDHMIGGIDGSLRHDVDTANLGPIGPGWTIPFRDGVILGAPRLGRVALQLIDGMYREAAAIAKDGDRVILDDVIFDKRVLGLAANALAGTRTLFVGVRCPLEIAIEREVRRGDRAIGGAAVFDPLVHDPGVYDLQVDTSLQGPDECARAILDAFQTAVVGGALQLAARNSF
jgi:chloramphenicol 3-O phosphotransferase